MLLPTFDAKIDTLLNAVFIGRLLILIRFLYLMITHQAEFNGVKINQDNGNTIFI